MPLAAASQLPSMPTKADHAQASKLRLGMQVQHPSFGKGTVTALGTHDHQPTVRIKFHHAAEKTLLLAFAKLRILASQSASS